MQRFWTCIRSIEEYSITDAVFYKGQVYAVETNFGRIVSFDVKSCCDGKPQWAKTHYTPDMCSCSRSYLVESTKGDLLFVRKFSEWKQSGVNKDWLCTSVTFMIYKVVFSDEDESIIQLAEIKNIGDDALFLFDSHSISVSAGLKFFRMSAKFHILH